MQVSPGQKAVNFALEDIHGRRVYLHDLRGKRILLSFYRDAGCPFCNLRIYELTRYFGDFAAKNFVPVAVFNSKPETVRRYLGKRHRPFPMLADPEQHVFQLYGVTSSWPKLLACFFNMPRILKAFSKGFGPSLGAFNPLLPADFLIDPDLVVQQAFYSQDAAAHIPIRDIETFLATPMAANDTAQQSA
jgi:peroxiredoxin Q/BCP